MREKLTIDCLRQRAQFDQLEPEWDALLEQADVASPFLTPGWQSAWLNTYGRGHALLVLTARRGGTLIGLWPLALVRRRLFRVLEPVGAGRSDWLDVLCIADARREVLTAFIDRLVQLRREWDLLECRDVLSESPAIAGLETACSEHGLRLRHEVRSAAPYLALGDSWEQFLKSKRPKFRTNLNYYRRVAEKTDASFSIARHQWRSEDAAVGELAEVELRSWKAQEGNLKISTALGRKFYGEFCSYFFARDRLDLWRADMGGRLIAFLVNIRFGGKCYHYNTCFDQHFGQISPGLLLHAAAISDAFDRGLSEYDFLSGDETYKERWSSARRTIYHLAIYDGLSVRSRLAFTVLAGARWTLRRSERLRAMRARLLAVTRKVLRRGGS